jgi:hypothetical protein
LDSSRWDIHLYLRLYWWKQYKITFHRSSPRLQYEAHNSVSQLVSVYMDFYLKCINVPACVHVCMSIHSLAWKFSAINTEVLCWIPLNPFCCMYTWLLSTGIFSKSVVDYHVSHIWWLHYQKHQRVCLFLLPAGLQDLFQILFLVHIPNSRSFNIPSFLRYFIARLGSLFSIISMWVAYCFCIYRMKKIHTQSLHSMIPCLKKSKWKMRNMVWDV